MVVVPAVLVVADEQALRVGRKGGLARTREAEEDGRILALLVGVGRTVHRSDALEWQEIVHVGEHALLHLAAIPRIDDDLHLFGQVEDDGRFGIEAELLIVRYLRLGSVHHHEVGFAVVLQLLFGRTDEHVLHEVGLPCHLHDETYLEAGIRIGAAESIHHEELLVGELVRGNLLELLPRLLAHGLVVVLILVAGPPDGIARRVVHHKELVLGRTAGIFAGHHIHRTGIGQLAPFVTGEGRVHLLLEKPFVRRIVQYLRGSGDTILGQINLLCHNLLYIMCLCYSHLLYAPPDTRNGPVCESGYITLSRRNYC